jgi:hypothetical protein
MLERRLQVLACEFQVVTDAESVVRWLDARCTGATQHFPVSERYRIEVRGEAAGFRVTEDGREGTRQPSLEDAGAIVLQRIHELAFEALADYTKVHAGSATWRGQRLLVVGAGRAGKTTLMTRLLYEGFAVEGDEMVLLRDGRATAYPRRFGIRRPTLSLVPQLGALLPDAVRPLEPPDVHGFQILALDPSEIGFVWHVRSGPVAHLFLLDGRHEGRTSMAACPTPVAVSRILAQSEPCRRGKAAWVRDVSALVAHARCHVLGVGDLDSAVDILRRCLGAPAPLTLTA